MLRKDTENVARNEMIELAKDILEARTSKDSWPSFVNIYVILFPSYFTTRITIFLSFLPQTSNYLAFHCITFGFELIKMSMSLCSIEKLYVAMSCATNAITFPSNIHASQLKFHSNQFL